MMFANAGVLGMYTITECDASSAEAKKMIAGIRSGNFLENLKIFHEKFAIKRYSKKNIVPLVGLESFAYSMVNGTIPFDLSPHMTFAGLGTGTATPVSANTRMANEVYRQEIEHQSWDKNVAMNTIFLDYTEGNGNIFSELGLFAGDATSELNSGRLMSHVKLDPTFEKTDKKTLTIEVSHTFSSL